MSFLDNGFGALCGIFARTFPRASLGETLDAAYERGFTSVQLNLSSAGLPTLPDRLADDQVARIDGELTRRGMTVVAISGTFNMIDPNAAKRRESLRRLDVLAGSCRALGTSIITLCTGTRDPDDMWRGHAENDSPEAWSDLAESMRQAVAIADRHDLTLAFEPEVGNVVDSAAKARRLIDEIGSSRLKVVLDVANLIRPGNLVRVREVIDEAFDLLGPHVALIHAKEIAADGSVGQVAPGKGVLDFSHLFRRCVTLGRDVPIIVHGLPEEDAACARLQLWTMYSVAKFSRTFRNDGVAFRYLQVGTRLPFVFQHGLGGDVAKMHDLISVQLYLRLITFDARYHGLTRPLGPPGKIGFNQSADDLLALLDFLGVEKAVIGGLSMGAGIALNFATRYPDRTLALVLSRPAWLDQPFPENIRMFPEMAALIRDLGARAARDAFVKTKTFASILATSTDSAASILGMFDDPACEESVERFERIPHDCPSRDRSAWQAIRVPTLVLANHQDPIHPFAIGEALASEIPGAELQVLTPKCVNLNLHNWDFTRHVGGFLDRHFPGRVERSFMT